MLPTSTTEAPAPALLTKGTKNFKGLGVTVELVQDFTEGMATIKLAGPDHAWFGIGFDALSMADRPYTIIVDGSSGSFQERKLAIFSSGDPLPFTLEEVGSTSYMNGKCHIEFRRPLVGNFGFPATGPTSKLNMIAAIGSEPFFSKHVDSAMGEMMLERV